MTEIYKYKSLVSITAQNFAGLIKELGGKRHQELVFNTLPPKSILHAYNFR